jgi:hypothetical protein
MFINNKIFMLKTFVTIFLHINQNKSTKFKFNLKYFYFIKNKIIKFNLKLYLTIFLSKLFTLYLSSFISQLFYLDFLIINF